MTPSEAGRLSRLSREQLQAEIDVLANTYRPKILREYWEDGHKVTVWEAATAEGGSYKQFCKPTGRQGTYEL